MKFDDVVPTREFSLERLTFAHKQEVPRSLLEQLSVEKYEDFVTGRWVFVLRAAIFAQRLDEQAVRYPADWWQAFKRRFFPAWALRRWPVLETVKVMRLYAWYPEKMIPGERSQFIVKIDAK